MNLEQVEQRCLRYLEQASDPLVPLSTLLAHLWSDEQFAELTERDLLSFLRKHELVHVVEPELRSESDEPGLAEEADVPQGPHVILRARIPTKDEMAAQVQEQLERMTAALEAALDEAVQSGDAEAQHRIAELLERSQEFRKKINDSL